MVATLRVSGATCAEITRRIGVPPDRCDEAGTLLSPRHPRSARRDRAAWRLGTESDDRPLADHLRELLGRLAGRAAAVRAFGDDADVFCFVADPVTTLDAALLGELAAFGVEVVLDVYPPESPVEGKRSDLAFDPVTGWRLRYESDNGQGSVELSPAELRRLAAPGLPLTVHLGPAAP
ncbi:MAG TPA: DUF4279 domain-containing protein [Mycobacteriales bacterium]|jgi:hypothetical protein|nr:DUF4279 domain-containing protein [Mycobacteriales bacterium]